MFGASSNSLLAQLLKQQTPVCHALVISSSYTIHAARSIASAATVRSSAATSAAAAQQHVQLAPSLSHPSDCSCSRCSPLVLYEADTLHASSRVWCPTSSSTSRRSSHVGLGFKGTNWVTSRGFAAFSGALPHEACSHPGHHGEHHHDVHACDGDADQVVAQIQAANDLQRLQSVVQQHSSSLTPHSTAAAFKRTLQLVAGQEPSSTALAEAVLQSLTPAWLQHVQQASITDLSNCLFSCAKLNYKDPSIWSKTLAAVPTQCADGDGRDLANIAFALATTAEQNAGQIPGVSKEEVQEVLRVVTHQVVSMVSGPGGASDHSHSHDHDHHGEGGCGHQHHKSDKKSVTIGNVSTVRWAHEVFESLT